MAGLWIFLFFSFYWEGQENANHDFLSHYANAEKKRIWMLLDSNSGSLYTRYIFPLWPQRLVWFFWSEIDSRSNRTETQLLWGREGLRQFVWKDLFLTFLAAVAAAVVGPGLILFVRDEACLFTDQRRCRMGKFTYIEYYMKDGEMNGRVWERDGVREKGKEWERGKEWRRKRK